MSTLKIEERIVVSAPPARVWAFLLDPARVAPCLPGARLDGIEGDKTFLGTMKVKVGPVTMEFKGKATMTEIDEVARRVVLSGSGNDKGGSGSAKMAMESRIVALENGGSEILVVADVDLRRQAGGLRAGDDGRDLQADVQAVLRAGPGGARRGGGRGGFCGRVRRRGCSSRGSSGGLLRGRAFACGGGRHR